MTTRSETITIDEITGKEWECSHPHRHPTTTRYIPCQDCATPTRDDERAPLPPTEAINNAITFLEALGYTGGDIHDDLVAARDSYAQLVAALREVQAIAQLDDSDVVADRIWNLKLIDAALYATEKGS